MHAGNPGEPSFMPCSCVNPPNLFLLGKLTSFFPTVGGMMETDKSGLSRENSGHSSQIVDLTQRSNSRRTSEGDTSSAKAYKDEEYESDEHVRSSSKSFSPLLIFLYLSQETPPLPIPKTYHPVNITTATAIAWVTLTPHTPQDSPFRNSSPPPFSAKKWIE